MNNFFHFILNIVEFFYKKRIINKLTTVLPDKINVFFDIGAHHGETTIDLLKYFKIKSAYLFEPNKKNFSILKKKFNDQNKIINLNLLNFALGNKNKVSYINEVFDSSSSTINKINKSTKYFKRKKKILKIFNSQSKIAKSKIEIKKASHYIINNSIQKIDFIKLDTEGYEFIILNDLKHFLKNIKLVLLEHHYDLMITKSYKFSDLHSLFQRYGFKQIYKSKMIFRKSFEYIYVNKNYKNDK